MVHVHHRKPDPRIYQLALQRLGCAPEACFYVGDGSDRELTGAREAGIQPILIAAPLTNAYDVQRPDVESWQGKIAHTFPDLVALLL